MENKEKKHMGKKEFVTVLLTILIGALVIPLWQTLGYTGIQLSGITLIFIILLFFVLKKYVHRHFEKKEQK